MALLRMRDYLTVLPSSPGSLALADSSGQDAGVVVRVSASHSGRVNGNFRFYRPDYMRLDYESFAPKGRPGKPVLWNHDSGSQPIGRVLSARYVDESEPLLQRYPQLARSELFAGAMLTDNKSVMKAIDAARFIYSKVQKDNESYTGAGYIDLEVRISEPDAVARLQRGEYLTVSVGFSTDEARCSICGTDWADEGRCEHVPGQMYDGQLAFLIAGRQSFEELSFVNTPADPYAFVVGQSELSSSQKDAVMVMAAGMRPFGGLWQTDSCAACGGEADLQYFNNPDEHYDQLWEEIQAGLSDGTIQKDWLSVGFLDGKLTAAQRKKLKKSQFCGPNRTFPVPDCAHVTAALRLLGRAKVSEDVKRRIRACVMRKAKAMGCPAAKNNDSAWLEFLEWMLDDIRPASGWAGQSDGKGVMTVEDVLNMQLDAASLAAASDKIRELPAGDAVPVWDALIGRLRDSGWFASADGWTEAEIRWQLGHVDEIVSRLPEDARDGYLDRLKTEAESFGLDLMAAPAPETGQNSQAPEDNEEEDKPGAQVVAMLEQLENLVSGMDEEDSDRVIQLLFALAEKLSQQRFIEYLKTRLADHGMVAVSAADAETASRLRSMLADLKEANRRLLADRKRDLASQVVYLMALTGDSGFDVLEPKALEDEIQRRASRQLSSLLDALSDLRSRFFRQKPVQDAEPEAQEGADADAVTAGLDSAEDPGWKFLTDADIRALAAKRAVELYRRLKGVE